MGRYGIFLVAIPVAAICVRLGIWQVSRLEERRALNASLRASQALPPVALDPPPAALPRFRRVTARGAWDYDRQVIVEARSFEGAPAVIVATPLRLPGWGGPAVLVERGWVLSPDARRVDLPALREADSASVEGIVTSTGAPGAGAGSGERGAGARGGEWPRYVAALDPGTLAPLFPYPLLAYVVRRTGAPAAGTTAARALRPVPVPGLSDGPHLSYAIQWFAFALIAVVGAGALYYRERGTGNGEGGTVEASARAGRHPGA